MKKKKHIGAKIASVFAYLVIAVIALALVFVIYSGIHGNAAFIGGYAVMWVETPSMEPLIPARSYIFVKEATGQDVKVGDVIVFRSDDPSLAGAYNTHRVVEISPDGKEFTTKGDNNGGVDPYTAKADKVAGIYRKTLSTLSVFGRFLSTPIGMTAAGAIVLGILFAVYMPELKRATREKEEEAEEKHEEEIQKRIQEEVERLKAENHPETLPVDMQSENAAEPPEAQPENLEIVSEINDTPSEKSKNNEENHRSDQNEE